MNNATRHRRAFSLAITLALLTAASTAHARRAPAASVASVDAPMAQAWPARRAWNEAVEAEYGAFVAAIGQAVAANRCHTLAQCLNNAAINPLHETGSRPLRINADCADTPYTLRAYFAYRKGLPFGYMRRMAGRGHDARYLRDARPTGERLWTEFATPRRLLESIGSDVHSGYFRTAPDVQDADFYQTAVDRQSIRPGTMYYNPNGHVLVVYEVTASGDVLMFDGHPGNGLSHPRFTERLPLGTAPFGGGFRNFRPVVYEAGRVVHIPNARIPEYGGSAQFDRARYSIEGRTATYHAWVRARLMATAPATVAVATAMVVATATPVARREAVYAAAAPRVIPARSTPLAMARPAAFRARIDLARRVVTASLAAQIPRIR